MLTKIILFISILAFIVFLICLIGYIRNNIFALKSLENHKKVSYQIANIAILSCIQKASTYKFWMIISLIILIITLITFGGINAIYRK